MKRKLLYAAVSAIVLFAFAACSTEKEFNQEFLYGEWKSTQTIAGTSQEIHDQFNSNGMGSSWSVTQGSPPQAFKWTLSGETLTFLHCTDMSGGDCKIPKEYTVTELTATTLIYHDYTGKTISCTKVN